MEGEDVILRGLQAILAFHQLQASVKASLTLSMDKEGKVSYNKNKQKNGKFIKSDESAKQLMNAIDDHSVIVNYCP